MEQKSDLAGGEVQTPKPVKPPIKSGWRGNISGHVENTDGAHIEVSEITMRLDKRTAYALANLLDERAIERSGALEDAQKSALISLGAALGRLVDHHAANNGGRVIIK